MGCIIKGKVVEILERGFCLDEGMGLGPVVVRTQTAGSQLGLQLGDQVGVFGGGGSIDGEFASGSAWKLLPSGEEVEIPVSLGQLLDNPNLVE